MTTLLAILSTILLIVSVYTHEVIRKEYGNIMVPRYIYFIIGLSGSIAVYLYLLNF
jgi:multisubunit Na+/H+ antiporter MnhB subunit